MERPLEWLVLICIVAIVGVLTLRHRTPSVARQALVGAAIGVVSAAIVLSGQGDLVPDGMEPIVAPLAVAAVFAVLWLTWLRRAHRD